MTKGISKQLLPIYDKPVIYYPLSVLMLAGIRDIMIISTPRDIEPLRDLLGEGSQLGVRFSYRVQDRPEGIAQAFLIAEDFIGDDRVSLILGDNFFYGRNLNAVLEQAHRHQDGAMILASHVNDPERYGIVEFDKKDPNRVLSLEEKPLRPKSRWAVTGLYFYDRHVVRFAKQLEKSARSELEITDLNRLYLAEGRLSLHLLGRGFTWLDMGTPDSVIEASNFVQTIEKRQGLKIACLEEIAFGNGFITYDQFRDLAERAPKCVYGDYLREICSEREA